MRITSSTTTIFDMRRIALALLVAFAGRTVHAQDWAKARLEKSPRRHEQVVVKHDGRAVTTLVFYPETKDKKPVVLLIHSSAGITDWFQSFADQVAAMGYIVVVPDLSPGSADLNAVADYGIKLPASNGTLFVAGIGSGGTQSFRFAADRADVAAALVFCGSSPDKDSIARIKGSVFGFYA